MDNDRTILDKVAVPAVKGWSLRTKLIIGAVAVFVAVVVVLNLVG